MCWNIRTTTNVKLNHSLNKYLRISSNLSNYANFSYLSIKRMPDYRADIEATLEIILP